MYDGKQIDVPAFIEEQVGLIRAQVGGAKVVLGLSGGVDSTVTALLVDKAIGKNLVCIFVDHGLLRKGEFEDVLKHYEGMGLNVIGVRAAERFLQACKGLTDPELKRKAIGKTFIDVFADESSRIEGVSFLAQGTIWPDIAESFSDKGVIKSHHNVGGLPEKMGFELVEPLKYLYKYEVREVGKALGLDDHFLSRHPFPGPGLGVRCLGELTAERLRMLQEADAIFIDNLREAGLYEKIWQAGAILLPVQSTGIKDGRRSVENVVALRAVNSVDAVTASVIDLPFSLLQKVALEIAQKVNGVGRVVYDVTPKPPATIEW